jgi:hypothetical protein
MIERAAGVANVEQQALHAFGGDPSGRASDQVRVLAEPAA